MSSMETIRVKFTPKDPYRESYLSGGLLLQPTVNNNTLFDNACFLIIDHNISEATIDLRLVSCPFNTPIPSVGFSFESMDKEDLSQLSGEYAVTSILIPGNNEILKAKQEEVMALEKEYTINLNFFELEVLGD